MKNENQTMVFELGKTTKSMIQTQYGTLNMKITTNHIEVIQQKDMIKKIHLMLTFLIF